MMIAIIKQIIKYIPLINFLYLKIFFGAYGSEFFL